MTYGTSTTNEPGCNGDVSCNAGYQAGHVTPTAIAAQRRSRLDNDPVVARRRDRQTPTGPATLRRTRSSSRAPSTHCTRPRGSPTSASTPARASGTPSSATTRPSVPYWMADYLPSPSGPGSCADYQNWVTSHGAQLPGPPEIVQYNSPQYDDGLRLLAPLTRSARCGIGSRHGRALRVAGTLRQRRRQRAARRGLRATPSSTSTGGARSSATAWGGSARLTPGAWSASSTWPGTAGSTPSSSTRSSRRRRAGTGSAAGSLDVADREQSPGANGSTSTSRRTARLLSRIVRLHAHPRRAHGAPVAPGPGASSDDGVCQNTSTSEM